MPNTFFFSKGRRASEHRGDRSQEKEKNWKNWNEERNEGRFRKCNDNPGSLMVSEYSRDVYLAGEYGVTDMVLLYNTLVSDGAIPAGFLAEFVTLEQALKLSSKRAINIAANRSDAEAERL